MSDSDLRTSEASARRVCQQNDEHSATANVLVLRINPYCSLLIEITKGYCISQAPANFF